MKKWILGAAALTCSCMTWWVAAAEPSMEERCKAIAVQHGLPPAEIDAWVKKCLEHTRTIRPKDEAQQPPRQGTAPQGGPDKGQPGTGPK